MREKQPVNVTAKIQNRQKKLMFFVYKKIARDLGGGEVCGQQHDEPYGEAGPSPELAPVGNEQCRRGPASG